MRNPVAYMAILACLGCGNETITKNDLHYLNGYWEIKKVEFTDRTKKRYGANPSMDFIQLKGMKGLRKKVKPMLDGTYIASNDQEPFTILERDGAFMVHYKTDLDERQEELVQIDSTSFTVVNKEGVMYSYKRFKPISVTH